MSKPNVFNEATDGFKGRGLTDWMLRQFIEPDGILHPILLELQADTEGWYELEIRRYYVNIYYRGGNLMEIRQPDAKTPRLTGSIDKRYIERHATNKWRVPPTDAELATHDWLDSSEVLGLRALKTQEDAALHAESFVHRRDAMDANKLPGRRPKHEREAQQRVASANNSQGSEYVVCDVEYSATHRKPNAIADEEKTSFLDLVAAYRPDCGQGSALARLALIELKYAQNAIDGAAGLRDHVDDIHELVTDPGRLGEIAAELERVMRHKHRLGLTPVADLRFDRAAPVDYIIAVAEHNSRSQKLRDALLGRYGLDEGRLRSPKGLNVKIAILEADHVIRHDRLIALEDITEESVPDEIFSGTLRTRRYRTAELPQG